MPASLMALFGSCARNAVTRMWRASSSSPLSVPSRSTLSVSPPGTYAASRYRLKASPRQSKPAPILDVLHGTRTPHVRNEAVGSAVVMRGILQQFDQLPHVLVRLHFRQHLLDTAFFVDDERRTLVAPVLPAVHRLLLPHAVALRYIV